MKKERKIERKKEQGCSKRKKERKNLRKDGNS